MRKLVLLAGLAALASAQQFELDAGAPPVAVWGRGTELPRVYFDEWLPAIFERTLQVEAADLGDGALEWMFTGERGGFTVRVDGRGARLFQRYYDSFAHNALEDGKVRAARHPERRWLESETVYQGALKSVTVALDHRLGLELRVNGAAVARQVCLLDVRRHQLRFDGKVGKVRGRLVRPPAAEAAVRVDSSNRHQTMIGFGGIASPPAYAQLSPEGKKRWWQYLGEYNLLLHREYPNGNRLNPAMDNWDRLADATPHYYGDNFPNGEISDFEYMKQVVRMGGKVLFEFWDIPVWARDDKKVAQVDEWVRAMLNYCRTFQKRTGAAPAIMGIQNEKRQPEAVWHRMTLRLRQELDKAGFKSVKIHMQDAGIVKEGIENVRAFRRSAQAWAAIDYAASHMYDYQSFADPDEFDARLHELSREIAGKPFLSTEICVNQPSWQVSSYRMALMMGQLYHKNLTILDAAALIYCWLILNVEQPSYGATRSLFVPDPARGFMPAPSSYQLRVLGAYSRRVKEGMVRVEASSSDAALLVTAFEGQGGARTVVVLNRGLAPRRVRVDWPGAKFGRVEVADPYRENELRPGTGAGEVTVEPGAVMTLATASSPR